MYRTLQLSLPVSFPAQKTDYIKTDVGRLVFTISPGRGVTPAMVLKFIKEWDGDIPSADDMFTVDEYMPASSITAYPTLRANTRFMK